MRGRNRKKMNNMRLGQTIVAERERAESESERMQARKRVKRRQRTSAVIVVLMLVILGLVAYLGVKEMSCEYGGEGTESAAGEYEITAEIVDEDNRGQISMRVKEYVAQLEEDFRELGHKVTRVVLPTGTSRELYVDLEGREGYFKVNIDRDAAVSAEDAVRMLKYLDERDLHPEYVDVRVEGKAYYK